MTHRRRGWRSRLEARRTTKKLLRDLDIRPPLDVAVLAERLGAARERPIRLLPWPLPVPGPFGVWLQTASEDIVVYQSETTPGHQEHIVLHEIGHIVSNHHDEDADDDLWSALTPNLPAAFVRSALARRGYDSDEELEAELVATVIKEWAGTLEHLRPVDGPFAGPARIQGAFDDHQGWL